MTVVRSALVQARGSMSMAENVERQIELIGQAARHGAQITCLQELATGPYFCQVQDPQFYEFAEPVPGGLDHRADAGACPAARDGADRAGV